jgi:predicted transcriptional regulator
MPNKDNEITLDLLNTVEDNSNLTQRSVASDLNIALGLANAYLKRCVAKGFIKVSQAPRNRYAYYLTPKGFAEKSRLTARYLSQSFNLFRLARKEYGVLLDLCVENGWDKVVLVGAGDLGEVVTLCALELTFPLTGFVDDELAGGQFAGLPVYSRKDGFQLANAALITDLKAPQQTYEDTLTLMPPERVLVPRFLKLSRNSFELELPEKAS